MSPTRIGEDMSAPLPEITDKELWEKSRKDLAAHASKDTKHATPEPRKNHQETASGETPKTIDHAAQRDILTFRSECDMIVIELEEFKEQQIAVLERLVPGWNATDEDVKQFEMVRNAIEKLIERSMDLKGRIDEIQEFL